MEIQYHKWYSRFLDREMEYKVYGHGGVPVLYVPCQGGRFFDFENYNMLDVWRPWIEDGRAIVFSVDTLDAETWACADGDPAWRTARHEAWYNYIVEELVPAMQDHCGQRGITAAPFTFGCSLGASHAANLFFRRPDIFGGVLALSGYYDSSWYFGDYMDQTLYDNTPCAYLENMPEDHPYIQLYNQRKMVFCVGQGAWEDELKASTGHLADILWRKGVHAQVDFWGWDVDHDWPWWYRQAAHYVPGFLY